MGYVSTWMGDRFSALLVSLMALQLMLVDQNPFRPCFCPICMVYLTVLMSLWFSVSLPVKSAYLFAVCFKLDYLVYF